jgi:hypothetical protein
VCVCSLSYLACKACAPVMLSSVACPALLFCPHYLVNGTVSGRWGLGGGRVGVEWLNLNVCFDFLYSFETFLILIRSQLVVFIYVYRSSCTIPIIIVSFQWNLNFLNRFSKNALQIKFYNICSVENYLFNVVYFLTYCSPLSTGALYGRSVCSIDIGR